MIERLTNALRGLDWEAVFVDDDSPDGTAEVIAAHIQSATNLRLIHRVGTRGLSSACIEGMMAARAPFVAVMDADLQHDETCLPKMLELLRGESLDLVVGTRNAGGGSMGEFGLGRVLLSRCGQRISQAVCRCELTDPMSGFFMIRKSFLLEVVDDLQREGFKILFDVLSSARRPVRLGEVGYTFGARRHGESKLDVVVGIEYLFLVVNKLLGGKLPVPLLLYVLVGGLGVVVHLAALLGLTRLSHMHFVEAQSAATFVAMGETFLLNNWVTFRDRRMQGTRMAAGMVRFMAACSFGAWANVVFARALFEADVRWYWAGLAGILIGSMWNLSVSSAITWPTVRATRSEDARKSTLPEVMEVSH